MPTNSNRHRYEVAAAGSVPRSIVPDPDALRSIGRLVADVCQHASDAAPNCWEVTLRPDVLRVNVGQVAVVSIDKSHVFLCTEPIRSRPRNLQSYWSRRGQAVYAAVIDFFNALCSRSVCQPAYWEAGDFASDDNLEPAKGDLSQEDLVPSRDVEEAAVAFVTKRYRDSGYKVRSSRVGRGRDPKEVSH